MLKLQSLMFLSTKTHLYLKTCFKYLDFKHVRFRSTKRADKAKHDIHYGKKIITIMDDVVDEPELDFKDREILDVNLNKKYQDTGLITLLSEKHTLTSKKIHKYLNNHSDTPYNKILSATELSSALYCCTRLKFVSERLYNLLLSQITDKFFKEANTSDMTTTYHSLSILEQRSMCPELNDILINKCHLLHEKIKELKLKFSVNELTHILASMHLLAKNDLDFIDYIIKSIINENYIDEIPGNLLCNIMLTIIKSGYINNNEFNLMLATKSVEKADFMSQNELIKTLWSFSVFGKEFKKYAEKIIQSILETHKKRELKAEALNSVLECLIKLKIKNEVLVNEMTSQLAYRLEIDRFNKGGLCNIALNLGKLKYKNKGHWKLISHAILNNGKDDDFIDPKYIRNLILGWAHALYYDEIALDSIFKDLMEPGRLLKLNIEDLSKITWALGKLKYKNDDIYEIIGNNAISRDDFKMTSNEILYNFIIGWAHVDFQEVYCIENFIWQVLKEENLKKYKIEELLNLIYAFSHLGNINTEYFIILIKEISSRNLKIKLDMKNIRKLLLGCVKANYINNEIINLINLKDIDYMDKHDVNCIKISFKLLVKHKTNVNKQ